MKLKKGYSIGYVKENNNQYALFQGDCPCVGIFTNLIVECDNEDTAILCFNDMIKILKGKILEKLVTMVYVNGKFYIQSSN